MTCVIPDADTVNRWFVAPVRDASPAWAVLPADVGEHDAHTTGSAHHRPGVGALLSSLSVSAQQGVPTEHPVRSWPVHSQHPGGGVRVSPADAPQGVHPGVHGHRPEHQ